MERKKEKQIELLRVYVEGDQVYVEGSQKMDYSQVLILVGILGEYCDLMKMKPKKEKGKVCLN